MPLEKVLHTVKLRTTGNWKDIFMKHPLLRLVFVSLLAALATPSTVSAQVQAAPPIPGVIGKVQSFTGSALDIQTPSGVVHVVVKQPLTTYKQMPSDLSHITSASYVGVASTEQDGKEVAKQLIIFPAELSGAAEGSVLTDPPGATISRKSRKLPLVGTGRRYRIDGH